MQLKQLLQQYLKNVFIIVPLKPTYNYNLCKSYFSIRNLSCFVTHLNDIYLYPFNIHKLLNENE